jgi:hypothetical protein
MAKGSGGGRSAPAAQRRNSLRGAALAESRGERLKQQIFSNPQVARAGSLPTRFVDSDGRLWGADFGGRGGMAYRVMQSGSRGVETRGESKRMTGRKIYPVTRAQIDSISRAGRYLRFGNR